MREGRLFNRNWAAVTRALSGTLLDGWTAFLDAVAAEGVAQFQRYAASYYLDDFDPKRPVHLFELVSNAEDIYEERAEAVVYRDFQTGMIVAVEFESDERSGHDR